MIRGCRGVGGSLTPFSNHCAECNEIAWGSRWCVLRTAYCVLRTLTVRLVVWSLFCDSSVSIVTRLRAGQLSSRGSIPGRGNTLHFLQTVQTGSGAHPATCLMGGSSSRVKWPGREADHRLRMVTVMPALRYALMVCPGTTLPRLFVKCLAVRRALYFLVLFFVIYMQVQNVLLRAAVRFASFLFNVFDNVLSSTYLA